MDLTAKYEFNAQPEQVFDSMIDPAVVAACLPGCEKLEPIGDHKYTAALKVAIAAVTGKYKGTVEIRDIERPASYSIAVAGRGNAGFMNGEGRITLKAQGSKTLVEVAGSAKVGGAIARVGQRLLQGTSKMMTDRFFNCLKKKIESPTAN